MEKPSEELSNRMLKTDDFPVAHLATLTNQINDWLGDMIQTGQFPSNKKEAPTGDGTASISESAVVAYELGEQFLMVSLQDPEMQAVMSLNEDLGELVTLTGRRHHQLKCQQKAFAYARSLIYKDEALCQLFATSLAPNIQGAIKWLDEHETEGSPFANGSWRVRLLTIPTFHTHAFLIQKIENGSDVSVGEDYLLVISAPKWLEQLPKERLLTSSEFLLGFKDKTPITGLDGRQRPL